MDNNIIVLLRDNEVNAIDCKRVFLDDYSMYVSYLEQFRTTIDGTQVRIVPFTEAQYNNLSITTN